MKPTDKDNSNHLSRFLERSPFITLGTALLFGFTTSSSFWIWHYTDKIDYIEQTNKDRIDNLKTLYDTRIEIAVIKARQEVRPKGNLTIDENSKLGILLNKTINTIEREK